MSVRHSLAASADAIELLADVAAGQRLKPRPAELELLIERARRIVATLRTAEGHIAARPALEALMWPAGGPG